MSRSRRSVWNFGGSLVFTAATMIAGFVATPFLLRWLGTERFGAWRVLTDWGGYLTLLEFGLGAALWSQLATALGQKDDDQVARLLSAGTWAYLRVAGMFLLAGGLLLIWLPRLVNAPTLPAGELRWSWLVLLSGTLLLPLMVYRFLAEAEQKSYLVSLLNTFQGLLTMAFSLLAAWFGFGLAGQALATVSAQLPTMGALAWRGWGKYPLRFHETNAPSAREDLQSLNRPAFAYMTSMRVGVLSDNVVIAGVLGIAAVTPFFLTQRLIALAQTQLLGLGNATWAGLADLHALGEKERFHTRTLELTKLVSMLSLLVLAPLAAYSRSFLALWVGTASYGGAAIVWLACLNTWLGAIFYLWGWTLNGTGNISHWARYAVAFTLVNVAGSIGATFAIGLSGPLVGTLAGYLLITAWALPLTLQRVFGWAAAELWREALRPCIWAVPYAVTLSLVAAWSEPQHWARLGAEIGAGLTIGLTLCWNFGLTGNERAALAKRLKDAAVFN